MNQIVIEKSKWDGLLDYNELINSFKGLRHGNMINAWDILHTTEDSIPCDGCRKKQLTRGLHQVVNYCTRTDLSEIPTEYDSKLQKIWDLTHFAMNRAQREGRI